MSLLTILYMDDLKPKNYFKMFEYDSDSGETLKTEAPCTGSYPQACKRSQTVCRKSRGLPRLYWTSQFFSRGKHLMADELCAIHVKYIKFKKKVIKDEFSKQLSSNN